MKVFARTTTRQKLCHQYSSSSFRAASTKTKVVSHERDETREEFQVPIRRYRSDSVLARPLTSKRINDTVSKSEGTKVDQKDNRANDLLPDLLTNFSHEQLIAKLRDALQHDSTSIQDIRELLSVTRTRIEKLPFAERRDAASKGYPGGNCLRWLWENRVETLNEDIDRRIADNLCWFLHAENHMEYIDRWIDIAAREVTDAKAANGEYKLDARMTWGSRIFAGQVNAELAWSMDGSVDTALKALKARIRHWELLLGGRNRAFSYVRAMEALSEYLRRDECPPTTPELYKWFVTFNRISDNSGLHHATTGLWHPSQPNAHDFSNFILRYYLEPETREYSVTWPDALYRLGMHMIRAAYILQLQGKLEDACALEDLIIKHHPKVWQGRFTQYESLRKDPKLEQLRRNAEHQA